MKYFLLFLLILPIVSAVEDYGTYSSLDINFNLNSDIKINVVDSNYEVEYIKSDISFYPKTDERQKVLDFDLNGDAQTNINDYVSFQWTNPEVGKHSFGIESKVKIENVFYAVDKKVDFPIRENAFLEYTEPTKYIDITPEIEDQARVLIINEDDLFKVVFNIAEWTKANVQYNLSTLNSQAVYPSSSVLKSKEGVCDEITNLFISLLRSVGIPARFVSGMAYTNLENDFGNHGWAEVYFPGYGWIPYDVTFGQYAWIDPSHIKLKESKDSGSPSAEYSWRAKGVKLDLGDLDTDADIIKTGEKIKSSLDFSINPLKELIGFGDYVPLEVKVKNLRDHYVVADLFVVKAPGLVGSNSKRVLLEPGKEKNVYWILKVDDDLDPNYIYTATLGVKDNLNGYAESILRYSKDGSGYTLEESEKIVSSLSDIERVRQSASIGLECEFEEEYYYSNESAGLECVVKNLNKKTKEIEVCYRIECYNIDLASGGAKELRFEVDSIGGRIVVAAESDDGVKYDYINLNVIKLPEIYIDNFKPETVKYSDNADVSFVLKTNTLVRNVVIDTGYGKLDIRDFERESNVKYTLPARALVGGVKLKVDYEDEKGAKYEKNLAFNVQVSEIPWYVRTVLWFKGLF